MAKKVTQEAENILRKRTIFLVAAGMAAALLCVDTREVLADETDSYLPVFEEYRDAFLIMIWKIPGFIRRQIHIRIIPIRYPKRRPGA